MTHPDDPAGLPPADDAPLDAARFDAALRAAAHDYHAPAPPVPAEAMWAAIQARRAQARSAAAHGVAAAESTARPEAPALRVAHQQHGHVGRARPASRWASLAAAAVLLLGVGIGVGRYTALPEHGAVEHRAATGGLPARRAPAGDTGSGGTPAALPAAVPHAAPVAVAAVPVPRPRAVEDDRAGPTVAIPNDASAPLRAATDQHLARAEALLTTFAAHEERAGPGDGAPADTPDAAWARDLVTTTRLLLDSPAGRDPSRRALLEDLELVLGQIARLPHADTREERALIDRAIRRGDLMAKLRTAVPAGTQAPALARGS